MMQYEYIPANRKALKINIDTPFYGSFAEIGGGQEVARHFFQAGGASQTVAKTISAYDKSFSDELYNHGKKGRYVAHNRLEKMLDEEFAQLLNIKADLKSQVPFFAFADTIEVLNFAKTNQGHGWMGVKFQLRPGSEPNTVIIHFKLMENDGLLQQRTVGKLGVNLLYACFHYYDHPNIFIQSLVDDLSRDRFRITMMSMEGPELAYVDNRLLGVQLVKHGLTHAIMFDTRGRVHSPSDMLYKKNVLVVRGQFKPITNVALDIMQRSLHLFQQDEDYEPDNTLSFCELTLNDMSKTGDFDEQDFLERVNMLNEAEQNVMVSDFKEYFKLMDFFSSFKLINIRLIIGVPTLEKVLDRKYYTGLKGGLLEAMGKLFPLNMKLYVYPTMKQENGEIITSENIEIEEDVKLLFGYLKKTRAILDVETAFSKELNIRSHDVLAMIRQGNPDWKKYVPRFVARRIKEKQLFLK